MTPRTIDHELNLESYRISQARKRAKSLKQVMMDKEGVA